MNKKIIVGASGLGTLLLVAIGGFLLSGKTTDTAKAPAPIMTTSTSSGYTQSGMTKEQVKASQIRGGVYTFQVHSGLPIQGGKSLVLNNQHYKDTGNLAAVVPVSFLPQGQTLDTIKGRMVEIPGQLTNHPKYGEQWMATGEAKIK